MRRSGGAAYITHKLRCAREKWAVIRMGQPVDGGPSPPIDRRMHFPHLFSRRRLLVGAGLAVACCSVPRSVSAQFGPTGFHVLRARNTTAKLRGDGQPSTPVWGYGETVPGPTLRVRRGDELRVRVFNDLDEPTAVHWHGVRLPNAMDGVPYLTQPPIAPRESFNYRFRANDAGTFWYHPAGDGGEHASHGLYGVLIVGETEKIEVDRDLVLVFDDWRLTPEGAIETASEGRTGGHPTVNSVPMLDLPVRSNERLRLRLVNAARAQPFSLHFDRHAVWVMAIDGQPAEPFLARDSRIALGPGNRIDLFLDATLEAEASTSVMLENAGAEKPIARLVYGREPVRAAPLPEPKPLPANPLPARLEFRGAFRQDLPLAAGTRPTPSPHEKPALFTVKRGRVVVLALINPTDAGRAVHLHGHSMRLLDRLDDGWKPFWLDTVMVGAGRTERVAFLADNPGRWLIDCRAIGRAEGTATWFEVT
jgi:FtsP/CotA-like multicopper oxidase with cupredoxin domain